MTSQIDESFHLRLWIGLKQIILACLTVPADA